jgi:serine/threonine-protein kinase RIO1
MNNISTAAGYRDYTLPDYLPMLERGDAGGVPPDCRLVASDRQTLVWSQRLDRDIPAILKLYRNRGIVSWQREGAFRFRVQREFDALSFIDSRGIPCSSPLFWTYGVSAQFGRHEILATREVRSTVPLDRFCEKNDRRILQEVLLKAYAIVRLMHKSGCHHGALYQKNILVARDDPGSEPAPYIIDMPRAIVFPYDISGTRLARIDLYCLTRYIANAAGADNCVAILERYGLEKSAAQEFVSGLKDYLLPKQARHLFRTEAETWELLARIGVRSFPSLRLRE